MSLRIECVYPFMGRGSVPHAESTRTAWCESPAASTATTNAAPEQGVLFICLANVNLYVAFGTNPNPAVEPRNWIGAGMSRAFVATEPGIKAAWVAAS